MRVVDRTADEFPYVGSRDPNLQPPLPGASGVDAYANQFWFDAPALHRFRLEVRPSLWEHVRTRLASWRQEQRWRGWCLPRMVALAAGKARVQTRADVPERIERRRSI